MTVTTGLRAAASVLFSFLLTTPAIASSAPDRLDEQARVIDGARGLQVLLAQREIKSNINASDTIAAVAGAEGGLAGAMLGSLIASEIDANHAKRAELAIQPIREGLADCDVDTLAVGATEAAVASIPWFQPSPAVLSHDASLAAKSAALDASSSSQVGFFEYTYELSPDFSEIRVNLVIQMVNKATAGHAKPEARFSDGALADLFTITSVVILPSPSRSVKANAPRWSADKAALAHKALTLAFANLGELIPQALELTEAKAKEMTNRTRRFTAVDDFHGHLQAQGPDGVLLFDGDHFYRIQTLGAS